MNHNKSINCSNKHKCPCPEIDCENHGRCCDCIHYHKNRNSKPYCLK
ncbi:MAG: hypothetical protein V1663_03640 [archaeon]